MAVVWLQFNEGGRRTAKEFIVVTKVAKIIFGIVGLLFLIAGLLPALRGESLNNGFLGTATVFFLLALGLRPRRKPPPPEQGA